MSKEVAMRFLRAVLGLVFICAGVGVHAPSALADVQGSYLPGLNITNNGIDVKAGNQTIDAGTLKILGTQTALAVNTSSPVAQTHIVGGAAQTGTGTVTTTTSSGTVTGSGTAFTTQLHVGDALYSGANSLGFVVRIASDTSLLLFAPPAAAVGPGASFTYEQPATRTDVAGGTIGQFLIHNQVNTNAAIVAFGSNFITMRYNQNPNLQLIRAGGASVGSAPSALTGPGTTIGQISFGGDDGTLISNIGATIIAATTATTWDTTHHGASLRFTTVADNSATLTEQMRIQGSGGISLGNGVVGTDPGANNVVISGNLGVGSNAVSQAALLTGGQTITAVGTTAFDLLLQTARTAAANNDNLYGAYIAGSFALAGKTGVGSTAINVAPTWAAGSQNVGINVNAVTGATTNYGVVISAPSGGTTNIGLLNNGTTRFNGSFGINRAPDTQVYIDMAPAPTGNVLEFGTRVLTTSDSSPTSQLIGLDIDTRTGAGTWNTNNVTGLSIEDVTKNGTTTITSQVGLSVAAQTKGATNNLGIDIAAPSGATTNLGLRNAGRTQLTDIVGIGAAPQAGRVAFIGGSLNTSGTVGRGMDIEPTLVAQANADSLQGLVIAPTYSANAKTGLFKYGALVAADSSAETSSNKYAMFLDSQTGANANNYGLYVNAPSGASGVNESIHVQSGTVYFGGTFQQAGKTITYNNVSTVGMGHATIYGLDSRTGLTGTDGAATTLYTTTASNQLFRITADIYGRVAITGTSNYTITWTENSTTQTMVVNASALNTLGTATDLIRPDNATAITGKFTLGTSCTCDVVGMVEQVG